MNKYTHTSRYFYGNKISNYGIEHGRVDYRTLANSFNHVLNNTIFSECFDFCEWDVINGIDFDEEYEEYATVCQYYIIDSNGADILQELTDEIVYYNQKFDLYLWGVTHYGTAWDYVLTDIRLELEDQNE